MNAFVSHECLCVWFGVKVCVYTLHEWSCSHYENEFVFLLAETTFLHFFYSENVLFVFQSFLSS